MKLNKQVQAKKENWVVLKLSEFKMQILKIGGSVLTDKNSELTAKTKVINRLAEEIRSAKKGDLIFIHGGGSFGHPTAQKHQIKNGYKEASQKIGFAETHHVMTMLNGLVMDALIWHNIPAVAITPSSCIITEEGRIKHFDETILKKMLTMGFLPVLYGDVVLDSKLGFTVLSGDQIISYLARELNAEKVIVGVDVDGVFDEDPKINKNAKFFDHLNLSELKKLQAKVGRSSACDVTGGMSNKILELVPAIENGSSVEIVNATKPNRILKALMGEKVIGTILEGT